MSRYEDAANVVKLWDSQWGQEGNLHADIIEILRICHKMASTHLDIEDLADVIADYVIEAFVPQAINFDEAEEEPEVNAPEPTQSEVLKVLEAQAPEDQLDFGEATE